MDNEENKVFGNNFGNVGGAGNTVINNIDTDPQASDGDKANMLKAVKDYEGQKNIKIAAINYELYTERSRAFANQMNAYMSSQGYPTLMTPFSIVIGGNLGQPSKMVINGNVLTLSLSL